MVSRPAVSAGRAVVSSSTPGDASCLLDRVPSALPGRFIKGADGTKRGWPTSSSGFRRCRFRMSSLKARASVYTVQDGDTLSSIARKHNVPVKELRALNEEVLQGSGKKKDIHSANGRVLKSRDIIYVGEKLNLPINATAAVQADGPGSLLPPAPSFNAPMVALVGGGALLVAAAAAALYQRHPEATIATSEEAAEATASVDPVLQELRADSTSAGGSAAAAPGSTEEQIEAVISRAKEVEMMAAKSFDEDEYKEDEKEEDKKQGGLLGALGGAVERSQAAMAGAAGLLLGSKDEAESKEKEGKNAEGQAEATDGLETGGSEGATAEVAEVAAAAVEGTTKEESKEDTKEPPAEAASGPKDEDSAWASIMSMLKPPKPDEKEASKDEEEAKVEAAAAEGDGDKEEVEAKVEAAAAEGDGDKEEDEAKVEAAAAEGYDDKEEDEAKVEAVTDPVKEAPATEEEEAKLQQTEAALSTDELSKTMATGNPLWENALARLGVKAENDSQAVSAEEQETKTEDDGKPAELEAKEDSPGLLKSVMKMMSFDEGSETKAKDDEQKEEAKDEDAMQEGVASTGDGAEEATAVTTPEGAITAAAAAAAAAVGSETQTAEKASGAQLLRPEDAIWAAAAASASAATVSQAAKANEPVKEAGDTEALSTEENISKVAELRSAVKDARDEMELALWESAASIASGDANDPKQVEQKMEAAKSKVEETTSALEEAILKTSIDEATKANDAWASSFDEADMDLAPNAEDPLLKPETLLPALPEGRHLTGRAFVEAHTWKAKATQAIKSSGGAPEGLSDEEGPVEAPPSTQINFDLVESTSSNPSGASANGVAAAEDDFAPPVSMFTTKMALLDGIYGAGRGLDADNETRGAVEEALTQLETNNPNPTPSQAMEQLDGRWKLVYTTNVQALAVLRAFRNLPMVNVGDITQTIDGSNLSVENKVEVAIPFMMSLSAHAAFEVRTPHQMKVQFHKGSLDTRITTPQIFENIEVPNELTVMGQRVDLAPVQAIISPVNSALQTAGRTVASVVAPAVDVEIPSFLLITYLDNNLRVSRDDNGGVFVMVKDVPFDTSLMTDN